MKAITGKLIRTLIKPREKESHKGTYGHSLLIAGNTGKMGAAIISAKACLRCGTGLLSVNIPEQEKLAMQLSVPEAMLVFREQDNDHHPFSAIGIGPGLGTGAKEKALLKTVLKHAECPLVLDADALNLISANPTLWKSVPTSTIITPHPKEFDRLFGFHQSNEARIQTAVQKAGELNLIIVLKGHKTIVTSGARSFYNTTGNPGLAKGGSGDALTGMITAFLAQGLKPLESALTAVYLHGLAADITAKEQSPESMLITDVIEHFGKAFQACRKTI